MKPRISVITLGVTDLKRSVTFYHGGLGLPTQGIMGQEFEHGAVAFFDLSSGLKLALWEQADIAHDSGLPMQPISSTALTIGHNVMRKKEVARILEEAARAGARIVKPAQDTFWGGHAGYFCDPDGHLWEIVWNPDLLPQED